MPDNTTLNTGSGGDVIASDDISSVKFQRIKLIHGADGVNDGDVSAANPLPVENPLSGVTSAANTTTTPLGGAATFSGTFELVKNYASISVIAEADVVGTLWYDFSTDGATADHSLQLSNGLTIDMGAHLLVPLASYGRVRLVNGAGAQSSVNVETIYGTHSRVALPATRQSDTIGDYTDALNVRIITTPSLDEANGSNVDRVSKLVVGRNATVPVTEEAIWINGGAYTGWLQTAATVRVKSGGNVNDDSGGTGAQTVLVVGLDETWAEVSETLTLAGASQSSATTATFIRVTKVTVENVGTYGGANTGAVVIETTGSVLVANITAGKGSTQLSVYTIPLGFKGYVRRVSASVDGAKPGNVFFYKREDADDISTPFTSKQLWFQFAELSGPASEGFESLIGPFPAKTDLWAAAAANTGTTGVSVTYDLILVRA